VRWLKIKGHENYRICEAGIVYSKRTDRFLKPTINSAGTAYVYLNETCYQVARLVLDHFQPSNTKVKIFAWHEDFHLENCHTKNLTRVNRSDRLRMFYEIKKRTRGVYAYTGLGKNKFRAVLRDKKKKVFTVGYFKTKIEAEVAYRNAYLKMFKRLPY
jgi:hypothetical protein